jgi:hypothetical protein
MQKFPTTGPVTVHKNIYFTKSSRVLKCRPATSTENIFSVNQTGRTQILNQSRFIVDAGCSFLNVSHVHVLKTTDEMNTQSNQVFFKR